MYINHTSMYKHCLVDALALWRVSRWHFAVMDCAAVETIVESLEGFYKWLTLAHSLVCARARISLRFAALAPTLNLYGNSPRTILLCDIDGWLADGDADA